MLLLWCHKYPTAHSLCSLWVVISSVIHAAGCRGQIATCFHALGSVGVFEMNLDVGFLAVLLFDYVPAYPAMVVLRNL